MDAGALAWLVAKVIGLACVGGPVVLFVCGWLVYGICILGKWAGEASDKQLRGKSQ